MLNTKTADFTAFEFAVISCHQYDFGQKVELVGQYITAGMPVHWSYPGIDGVDSRIIVNVDDALFVAIPDAALRQSVDVAGYIYVFDSESGNTVYTINLRITERPSTTDANSADDETYIGQLVDRAEEAADGAEAARAAAQAARDQAAAFSESWVPLSAGVDYVTPAKAEKTYEPKHIDTPTLKAAMLKSKLDNTDEATVLCIGDSVMYGLAAAMAGNTYINKLANAISKYVTGDATVANRLYTASELFDDALVAYMQFLSRPAWSKQSSAYGFPYGLTDAGGILLTSTFDEYCQVNTGFKGQSPPARIKVVVAKASILADSTNILRIFKNFANSVNVDLTSAGNYYVYTLANDGATDAIQFQQHAANKKLGIIAVIYEYAAEGVQVVNAAISGTKASNWYQNLGLVEAINPVCTFIELGGNDVSTPDVPIYKSQMTTAITALKAYGDVVLVSYLAWAYEPAEATIAAYRTAQHELAEENGVEIFDVHDFWESGTWADAQGLLASDTSPKVHPNDAGHLMIWHYLANRLGLPE